MLTEDQKLGKTGEELARKFYIQQGFIIREVNWRTGHLEVDLIAENNDYIVFCEVKTRSSAYFGKPETFVVGDKQRKIIRAANLYINCKKISKEVRLDIIAITICGQKHILQFFPDAFKPKW